MNMNKTNNGHFRQNVCFVVSVSKSALGILYKIVQIDIYQVPIYCFRTKVSMQILQKYVYNVIICTYGIIICLGLFFVDSRLLTDIWTKYVSILIKCIFDNWSFPPVDSKAILIVCRVDYVQVVWTRKIKVHPVGTPNQHQVQIIRSGRVQHSHTRYPMRSKCPIFFLSGKKNNFPIIFV